ncbi:MAG: hypothetical protein ACLR8Y_11930 [Alistipes indistinctus]
MTPKINNLIAEIFGPKKQQDNGQLRTNARGGMALFVPDPDAGTLANALDRLGIAPDVNIVDMTFRRSRRRRIQLPSTNNARRQGYLLLLELDRRQLNHPGRTGGMPDTRSLEPLYRKGSGCSRRNRLTRRQGFCGSNLTLPAVKALSSSGGNSNRNN